MFKIPALIFALFSASYAQNIDLESLVKDLSDPDWQTREDATNELKTWHPGTLEFIKNNIDDGSLPYETRMRLRFVLGHKIEQDLLEKRFTFFKNLKNEPKFSEVVAQYTPQFATVALKAMEKTENKIKIRYANLNRIRVPNTAQVFIYQATKDELENLSATMEFLPEVSKLIIRSEHLKSIDLNFLSDHSHITTLWLKLEKINDVLIKELEKQKHVNTLTLELDSINIDDVSSLISTLPINTKVQIVARSIKDIGKIQTQENISLFTRKYLGINERRGFLEGNLEYVMAYQTKLDPPVSRWNQKVVFINGHEIKSRRDLEAAIIRSNRESVDITLKHQNGTISDHKLEFKDRPSTISVMNVF